MITLKNCEYWGILIFVGSSTWRHIHLTKTKVLEIQDDLPFDNMSIIYQEGKWDTSVRYNKYYKDDHKKRGNE